MNLTDDWDFYPCRVDDAPGSIFLNLALRDHLTDFSENTLYALQIQMLDRDAHGMGSAAEADALYPVEDNVVAALGGVARFIGRLRSLGVWQLAFMGSPGHEETVDRTARRHLDPISRQFSVVVKADPQWTYYSDFLFPDSERMRWIQDRRVVDALQRHGDPLTRRRRVDHWIYFPNGESRSAFAAVIGQHDFHVQEPVGDTPDWGVQIHRVDSVQLNDIHDVTTLLTELSERFDGSYDGWETSVEAD